MQARAPSPPRSTPRWRPITVCSIPNRSLSPSVCAKSRAVTSTSCPRARRSSITGRRTSTCGELVKSIQTFTPSRSQLPRQPARRPSHALELGAWKHRAHRQRKVGARQLVGRAQLGGGPGVRAHRGLAVHRRRGSSRALRSPVRPALRSARRRGDEPRRTCARRAPPPQVLAEGAGASPSPASAYPSRHPRRATLHSSRCGRSTRRTAAWNSSSREL